MPSPGSSPGAGDPFTDMVNRLLGLTPGAAPPHARPVSIGRLLNEPARELLASAAEHAVEDGGAALDTDDLLWAATRIDHTRELLRDAGIDPDALGTELTDPDAESDPDADPGESTLTPAAKRTLLAAHARSLADQAPFIGPEHILAALLDDPRSGTDPDAARGSDTD